MEGVKFMNAMTRHMDINVAQLCRVINYNKSTHMADVQPLVKSDQEQPMLINVPVSTFNYGGFTIVAPLKAGDLVMVVFLDMDSENIIITGDTSKANSTRKHALDDAIIVGSITPMSTPLNIEDNALSIKSNGATITIGEDGNIDIDAKTININGDIKVNGGGIGGNI